MSTIQRKFEQIRDAGRKGFIPFVTGGDPEIDTSLQIALALAATGADIIELGVPFSDPMADGPTIQRSSQRALDSGTNLKAVLDLIEKFREKSDTPIVLFSYLNPLMQFGFEKLAGIAAQIGIDGILVTDAIDEEAADIAKTLHSKDLDLISLIAPTTTDERLKKVCDNASGFVYAVSRAGVTGARSEKSSAAQILVERARKFTDLPIAVGFGISTREQILDVWEYADAAVVGSAIVAEIEKSDARNAVKNVGAFLNGLLPQFAKAGEEI
ncbi:MAG: tryptophan synthase subunit alpha [Acidobacteriota bacterium]